MAASKKPASKIITELEGFTANQMKKLTLEITSLLIEDTPRKTGWARSNWIPAIGVPNREVWGDPGFVSGVAQQQGLADVVIKYEIRQGPIFISNNVPYIRKLNEGHSNQAPVGFVQIARNKGLEKVKTQK